MEMVLPWYREYRAERRVAGGMDITIDIILYYGEARFEGNEATE